MVPHRRTRIVCVSDTHGYTPSEAGFQLPAGDVLIHAGDLTNKGRKSELQRTLQWIQNADYEVKIVVAGNHDLTLDRPFYAQCASDLHGQHRENSEECRELIKRMDSSVVYLQHSSAVIKLTRPDGPRTMFKVFGSPYSRFRGQWAFGYNTPEDGKKLWSQIPNDVDIVVAHTPPKGLRDESLEDPADRKSFGCEEILQALSRVRPLLTVCGHVHQGHGCERVQWANPVVDGTLIAARQEESLPPIGSKKQSLVDMTGRRQPALDNVSHFELLGSTELMRRETCVVNAAIMASNWPHLGGKKFHRPIVVDANLPVWDSGS